MMATTVADVREPVDKETNLTASMVLLSMCS